MAAAQIHPRALHLALCGAALLCASAARAGDSTPPQIVHTPLARAAPGPIQIGARIIDESKIFPQLFFRYGSSGLYEAPLDLKKVKGSKDGYEASVQAKPGLEYYLECYDEFGNGPTRAGSPDQPFRVEVVEEGAAAPGRAAARPAPWLKGAAASPAPDAGPAPAEAAGAAATTAPGGEARRPALPASTPDPLAAAVNDLQQASSSAARTAAQPAATPAPAPTAAPAPIPSPAPAPVVAARTEGADRAERPADDRLREGRMLTTTLAAPAPLTAGEAFWHSALLPGWGQWRTERPIRGAAFGAATGLSLIATVVLAVRAQQANDTYESAPLSVRQQAWDQAASYAHSRNAFLALTVALWVANAFEAYLGYKGKDPG